MSLATRFFPLPGRLQAVNYRSAGIVLIRANCPLVMTLMLGNLMPNSAWVNSVGRDIAQNFSNEIPVMTMKPIILTLFLVGSVLSFSSAAKAEKAVLAQQETTENSQSLLWQPSSPTAGRYIVDLPGTPVEQTSTSTLLSHELRWHMHSVTLPAVDETDLFEYYLVAYADIPRRLRYEFSQKEVLDAAAMAIVSDIQSEQLSATLSMEEIAFQGLPSRLMTAEGLGQFLAATLTVTGDRLYLVLAIDDDQANFEHFFESFSVVP